MVQPPCLVGNAVWNCAECPRPFPDTVGKCCCIHRRQWQPGVSAYVWPCQEGKYIAYSGVSQRVEFSANSFRARECAWLAPDHSVGPIASMLCLPLCLSEFACALPLASGKSGRLYRHLTARVSVLFGIIYCQATSGGAALARLSASHHYVGNSVKGAGNRCRLPTVQLDLAYCRTTCIAAPARDRFGIGVPGLVP